MGGGRRFWYPKWVWTPTGGWWPEAKTPHWKRNTAIFVVAEFVALYYVAQWADKNTVRLLLLIKGG